MTEEIVEKITFELKQDEDGYPPDRWERLWAAKLRDGLYRIDNIPFYIKGVSSGDIVSVFVVEEELRFSEMVTPSQNSVIRLFVFEVEDVPSARRAFQDLGCESELSKAPRLFAIEVPEQVDFDLVWNVIEEGVDKGRWDFEIGVLRHNTGGALIRGGE